MSLKLPRNWDLSTLRAETTKIVRSKSVIPGNGSPESTRADARRPMEKPLKKGWLKKRRSIVKNWKMSYFVLRGNVMTYHKDDRESAVQGTIPLWASQVNELQSNNDDKFIFEIIPRSNGDRERDGCVLMASSQSEMEEWVRLIRRAIGAQGSGVFGKSLVDIMAYEKKLGHRSVPMLVEKCAEFITEHGLDEEGIFRLPGQENQVKHFREAFDAGERPSFPSDTDVHTVASLLKLYLRELPEPVVPWVQYQDFLDSTLNLDASTASGKEKLEKQISLVPKDNYNLLSYICRFLFEVQQHSRVNKMSVENLATVMGVNLFKPQVEDAFSMMKGTPMIQKVMTVMIRHHELLFPLSKEAAPSAAPCRKLKSKKSSNPRSFVGWESAECEMSSLSESPEEEEEEEEEEPDAPEGESRGSEVTRSPSADVPSGGPRKRTQTLPSISGSGGARASREPSWDRWSRLPEFLEDSAGKTFSEDIFKILFPERRSLEEPEEPEQKTRNGGGEVKHEEPPEAKLKEDPRRKEEEVMQTRVRTKMEDATSNQQQLLNSLQQRNRELEASMAELQAALDAERRSKVALEVLLRDAERSRDEALRRNEQLDREIQMFSSQSRPV